ncbi:DMT family transporter [Streptococcus porci]|uniref:DMT family transporter n=1 Tax=Streptococcus porci TaxID=502567 RepID=UPI0003FA1F24|nr:DMT family transporter [Streptococcus porci]
MSSTLKGSIMVVVAGIAWGISGVSGQYLMSHGIPINLLTSLRLFISGLVLTALILLTQRQRFFQALKSKHLWLGVILFSFFGLLLNQYAYLSAIHYTNAGTATVLQYMTPVLIVVAFCLKDRSLPTIGDSLAIFLAVLGTYIIATHGQVTNLAITPKGLFWGILSAFTYALYILIPAKLIKEWGSLIVIGLGMMISGIFFPIAVKAWQYPFSLTWGNGLALFGIVGVGTIFAYTVFLKGTTIIGAVKGSLLASVEPVASVIFGILIMHEHFYLIDLVGMTLIMLAVFLISYKDLIAEKRATIKKV